MNKQTSIALHLARVMGLQSVRTAPKQYQVGERVTYEATDVRREIFNPHANLAQWAECVLWAAMNDMCPLVDSGDCWATKDNTDVFVKASEKTQSSIQAATLEAIARATGWEESK